MNGCLKLSLSLGTLLLLCIAAAPLEAAAQKKRRVWTLEQVLKEKPRSPTPQQIDYCNGGRFEACVCWQDVAREVRYRPALKECGRKAAVIMSGKYRSIFSVVVRDSENRDRWPPSGFGGCSSYERDELGLSRCSAFKVQKRFSYDPSDNGDELEVFCLGASGYSKLFKRVVRITAKLADVPNSNDDPIVRWCLRSAGKALN